MLRDQDYLVRVFAVHALFKIDSPEAIEVLSKHDQIEKNEAVREVLDKGFIKVKS